VSDQFPTGCSKHDEPDPNCLYCKGWEPITDVPVSVRFGSDPSGKTFWIVEPDEHMERHGIDPELSRKPPAWFAPRFLFLLYGYVLGPLWSLTDRLVTWVMDRPASGCCGCGADYADATVYNGMEERPGYGRGESYCWACIDTIPALSPDLIKVYKGRERNV
jgi:hypothetical protein